MQQGSNAAICRWVFAKLFAVGLARRCILSGEAWDARETVRRHPTIAGWSASSSTAQSGPCGQLHPCSSSVNLRPASDALTTLRYHRRQWHVSPPMPLNYFRPEHVPSRSQLFQPAPAQASSLADASARSHAIAERRISSMTWPASPHHAWDAYLFHAKVDDHGG